jgi:hypothetical protein
MGNVFGMMFAGHGLCMLYLAAQNEHLMVSAETTAYSLASTIGFLGLHSDIQEDLYEQIVEVVGHDREPVSYNVSRIISCCDIEVPQTFEDFPRLEKVAHAFYEALRLYRWFFFAPWLEHYLEQVSDSRRIHSTSGGDRGYNSQHPER